MTYKVTVHPIEILTNLLIIFMISTLLQSLTENIAINKIIGAIIVSLTFLICLKHMRKIHFILLIIFFCNFTFSLYESQNISRDIIEWIYVYGTFFILLMLTNKNNLKILFNSIKNKIYLISWISIFCCLFILSLIFLKIGYVNEWGKGQYFIGLCNEPHTMASVACLLLSFIFFRCQLERKKRLVFLSLSIIPIYTILETGARIFLLPAVLFIILNLKICIKNKVLRFIAYIFGGIIFVFFLMKTSMMSKFMYALDTKYSTDILDGFTSGRSRFWKTDLDYYLSGNLYQILFGKSFSSIFILNEEVFNTAIGAHNDIIHLLNGTGIIGTGIYIYMIIKIILILKKQIKRSLFWLSCCIYLIVPMLMNGFFTYQHYVYSFVILVVALNNPNLIKKT